MAAGTSQSSSSIAKSKKKVGFSELREFGSLETHLEVNEDNEELSKREKVQILIKRKKECDAKARQVVLNLIESDVRRNYLLENAWLISPNHWEDVVEERKLSKLCGWVLCDNPITNIPKQQYSIRRNQVFDITERKSFCSSNCYAVSSNFKDQLLTSPLWLRDKEPIPEFEILADKSVELHGLDLRLNKLKLEPERDEDDDDEDEESNSDDKDSVDASFLNYDL